ncbi:1-phosphofructokinase family hexose kinase [Paenibacillus alba]|uniref:1-phosphofructokinase family hexose kinase n=1 Tax=Paenibacillus alba TaxID=1197127 RepID=UPI0015635A9B|nr:1-phosphofructokinase family hexose kinase [Paenibacillus alba]NQX71380.1 1-phosphofructokinase family hexose kinase [Paenibacillus alba]
MITTVTLNAAIDKTYYVNSFRIGEVQRVGRQIAEPGGKGNNVAKVIRLLGGDVTASGIVAGSSGSFIEENLKERGIETSFVRVPGESRVCLNILEESNRKSTELLEAGPEINGIHIAEMKEVVHRLALRSTVVVLSGSLPPGAPADLYVELIHVIRSTQARVYLDTSGAALSSGLLACPHFVKPNEQELAQWMGRERWGDADWVEAAEKLAGVGIEQVCVTLGSRGAIAFIGGEGYLVSPPLIKAVNTVGCGDSFVAGMAFADDRGDTPAERLRIAAAAAAANAMSDKAGHVDYSLFQAYMEQVKVITL